MPGTRTRRHDKRRALGGEENTLKPGAHEHEDEHGRSEGVSWREFNRVLFVAAAAAAIWFAGRTPNTFVIGIGVMCTLVGAFPIYAKAYESIVKRRMATEFLMAIAILAALAIREIFMALIITLFVLVAEILEGLRH